MSWGLVAVAGASVAGSVIGGQAQKKAAKQQSKAADASTQLQREMFEKQIELLDPFRQAGVDSLGALSGIAGQPINRQAELAAYYDSPEFAMQSAQARNQQLAASEATGGLGATSTSNALASIAPQLGQQYLGMRTAEQQDMYNQLLGMANIGLSGAGGQSAAAGAFGSGAANIMQQNAAQQAQAQLGQAQMWGSTLSNLGGLAYMGLNSPGGAGSAGTTNIAGGGAWNNIGLGGF